MRACEGIVFMEAADRGQFVGFVMALETPTTKLTLVRIGVAGCAVARG